MKAVTCPVLGMHPMIEARDNADSPLQAAQTHGRETNIECGAVIKPSCDKGVDKRSSSSRNERARNDT